MRDLIQVAPRRVVGRDRRTPARLRRQVAAGMAQVARGCDSLLVDVLRIPAGRCPHLPGRGDDLQRTHCSVIFGVTVERTAVAVWDVSELRAVKPWPVKWRSSATVIAEGAAVNRAVMAFAFADARECRPAESASGSKGSGAQRRTRVGGERT